MLEGREGGDLRTFGCIDLVQSSAVGFFFSWLLL